MYTDMDETRQNRGNAFWLPANTGFSTEAGRSMQWLLHELSAVISFIPQLSSQKPFLMSSGYDLTGFKHLDWVNNFMSRVLMLPSFLALLLNPMTSDLFPPLSFTWFDPAWQRRRRKRARRPEENTIETLLRHNYSLQPGQVRDFIVPSYPEDESEETEETKEEIITSFLSSELVRRQLPSLVMSRFPLSRHQKESMIVSNLMPTARDSSNYSDSIEMLHWLAHNKGTSVPSQRSGMESIYTENPQREMNLPMRSIQPHTFSSKVPIPLLINSVMRNESIEEEPSIWTTQPGNSLQVAGDRQSPEHQRVFISALSNLFTHPVHQVKSLPVAKWLTSRLQQWFSHKTMSPVTLDLPPDQKMAKSVIGTILPGKKRDNFSIYTPQTSAIDTTVSPELPGIPNTSIAIGSQHNFEQTSCSTPTYLSPFAFDFQQAMYPTAGNLPLAIRNSFSLTPHFQENPDFKTWMPHSQRTMASKTANALVKAISSPVENNTNGYHRTEGMELALAPVGRPRSGGETSETESSTREQSMERRSQAEEALAPDYEALATEVYDILKRKLLIEKERAQGIR